MRTHNLQDKDLIGWRGKGRSDEEAMDDGFHSDVEMLIYLYTFAYPELLPAAGVGIAAPFASYLHHGGCATVGLNKKEGFH